MRIAHNYELLPCDICFRHCPFSGNVTLSERTTGNRKPVEESLEISKSRRRIDRLEVRDNNQFQRAKSSTFVTTKRHITIRSLTSLKKQSDALGVHLGAYTKNICSHNYLRRS